MYKLIKKVPKSLENKRGSDEIKEGENPFESPCLLCLSAQDMDRHVFGITKNFMAIAGMRIRGNSGAKFDLEDFPVTFLSIQKQRDKETEEECADTFVDTYFMPLITDSKSKEDAMKKFRNINIMSYCDGTERVIGIVQNLRSKMQERGYSEQDLNDILSQISWVTLSTDRDFRGLGTTCVDFHDFNDTEVEFQDMDWIYKMDTLSELGGQEDYEAIAVDEEAKIAEYCIKGSGCHQVRQFFEEGKAMPVCLSTIVHNMLENSIQNSRSDTFRPLTVTELVSGCKEIFEKASQGKTLDELKSEVYENMQYTEGKKLTDRECELLDKLDISYDSIIKEESEHRLDQEAKKRLEEKNKSMLEATEQSSSETTYKKILLAQGWQFRPEEKRIIQEADTDKEVIKKQGEQIKKLQAMLKKTLSFADRVRTSRFGRFFFRSALKELPQGEEKER